MRFLKSKLFFCSHFILLFYLNCNHFQYLQYINLQYMSADIFNYIFLKPYLYASEEELFYKYLKKSNIYFEFGSGGTTHQALKMKLKIYIAEVHQCWIWQLKKEIKEIKKKLKKLSINNAQLEHWLKTFLIDITYIVIDIQSKINNSFSTYRDYVSLYNHTKYKADFIYIDKFFSFAISMKLFNEIDSNTIIFIHELEQRKYYYIIKNYYDIIDRAHKSVVLKKKKKNKKTLKKIEDYVNEDILNKNKNIQVISFLKSNFNNIIEKYRYSDNSYSMKPLNRQIWLFWWQGEKYAPYLVKACFASIKKNFNFGNITLLTKQNFKNFVSIPPHILKKFANKKITVVNFSDVLRIFLICTRGGLWLDATIFVARKITFDIFEYSYYTIRTQNNFFISFGKWKMFLQASHVNCTATKFVSELFYEYFRVFDSVFNYYMIDYFFLLGYKYIPIVRRILQAVPANNWYVYRLVDHINDIYSPLLYNYIIEENIFFKLTNKKKVFPLSSIKKLTIYGYIQKKG